MPPRSCMKAASPLSAEPEALARILVRARAGEILDVGVLRRVVGAGTAKRGYVCEIVRRETVLARQDMKSPELSACDRNKGRRVYVEVRGATTSYTIEIGWRSMGKRCAVTSSGRLA
jgi:radical SAM superfamily enzyme with C-terminal helix-hairpin-helix motif